MYETLKRLYITGKINKVKLNSAVAKGWITVAEKQEIISSNLLVR